MPLSSWQHQMLGGRGAGSGQQVLDIGTLTKHQYFGERALLDKGEHTACVVAITPVSLLVLSKYDFYHHVDARVQEMMKAYAKKFYMDESAIRRLIVKQYRWEAYKSKLLNQIVESNAHRSGVGSSRHASPRRSPRASPRRLPPIGR